MSINNNVLKENIEKIFVETGSYLGTTIQTALNFGASKVYSIELSKKYYNICNKKFKNNNKVELYLGDSSVRLKDVLEKIDEKCTFWLDGHWSKSDTALGDKPCPLIEELNIIKNHHIKNHIIMVDDMRQWRDNQWPYNELKNIEPVKESEIVKLIKEINPNYEITYHQGHKPNDILVAKIKK